MEGLAMPDQQEPVTQTMKASEAKAQWSQLLNQVSRRERRVLVEKDGKPVAAIISAADLARLERMERQREADFAILDEIGEAFKDQTPEDIEREVAKAVNAARAQLRKEARQFTQRP